VAESSAGQIRNYDFMSDAVPIRSPIFKHFVPFGRVPSLYTPAKYRESVDITESYMSQFITEVGSCFEDVLSQAKHVPANENLDLLIKSLKKCDIPTTRGYQDDPESYALAKKFATRMLSCMSNSKYAEPIDVNFKSSPGKPWINQGYRTKKDVIDSPDFPIRLYDLRRPVWHATTKTEFLPLEEVLDGKARSFFISPCEYVIQQKRHYDTQDAAMKSRCNDFQNFWSRYGFTKQYNGIDLLAHAHSDLFVEHEMGDVSGWDRLLPILSDVYDIRESYLSSRVAASPYLPILRDGLENQYIVMPNGEIYIKSHGNPSGSGKTSTDNTIAHLIIRFHFWIRFCKLVLGRFPTYSEILDNVIESLYGDDYLSSVSKWFRELRAAHFPTAESYQQFVSAHYQLYNSMQVKASAFRVSSDITDMEFLGSTFVFNERVQRYCGEPRWSKCISTLTKVLEERTPEIMVSTIVALYINSATGTPLGNRFQEFLVRYAKFLLPKPEFQDLPDIGYLSDIANGEFNTDKLLHGFESSSSTALSLEFV